MIKTLISYDYCFPKEIDHFFCSEKAIHRIAFLNVLLAHTPKFLKAFDFDINFYLKQKEYCVKKNKKILLFISF
jgi:hypothetical protein